MDTRGLPQSAAPSRARRGVRGLLLVAALGFVVWTFWGLLRRWDGSMPRVQWALVVASAPPLAIGVLIQAWAWTVLLRRMTGREIALRPAIRLHVDSMLARYTPGKVGLPIVRMAGAASLGVTATAIAVSLVIEMASFTAVGGVVGFGMLALSAGRETTRQLGVLGTWSWPLLAAFVAATLALMLLDRRRLPGRLLRLLRVDGQGPLLPALLPLLHVVYWATWVLHGYLITLAIGASPGAAFASSGLYVLAVVVGFLAMVAPAGAGVREAIISIGVAPAVGSAATLGAVLLSRATTLVMEVVVWVAVRALLR